MSWAMACMLLNSMNSLMTDLGVEKLILRFPAVPMRTLFPWASDTDADGGAAPALEFENDGACPDDDDNACHEPHADAHIFGQDVDATTYGGDSDSDDSLLDHFDRDDSSSDGGVDSDDDRARLTATGRPDTSGPTIDISEVFHMGGPQHAIHGIVKDLPTSMHWWSDFVLQLTHVCRLLNKSYTRDRFFQTCCTPGAQQLIEASCDPTQLAVYEARWGSVVGAVIHTFGNEVQRVSLKRVPNVSKMIPNDTLYIYIYIYIYIY